MEKVVAENFLKTRTSKDFLQLAFQQLKQRNPRTTYASIARKAGLSARSYVREIFIGKRPVTTKVFPSLVVGLELSAELVQYFQLLLALENDDFNFKRLSSNELREKLLLLRNKIAKRSEANKTRSSETELFDVIQWPLLFASLGTTDHGASLAEVSKRTGLRPSICQTSLEQMTEHGVVTFNEVTSTYHAKNHHVIFQHFKDPSKVQAMYLSDLRKLQARVHQQFNRTDHMFFDSCFSVNRQRLPALKKALWEVLVQFADEHEAADGDSVVTLISGLFPATEESS